ncbi:MAG TPA: molybdate ABC transporter substrate-binding protein [Baekduia sp.]|nr:molybdate ABC transporter substrate-binding protein [Baekduia sp.]
MKRWLVVAAAAALLAAVLAVKALPTDRASAPTVYAASSLSDVLPAIIADAHYSNGGSGALQAQIERGAPADVFASASPRETQALYRQGLCTQPVTFATNRLVLIVRTGGSTVASVSDLKAGGRRIAIGGSAVPIGAYTRKLLARMRLSDILSRNKVSNESNVSQITAKVALGSADAGFVYYTDGKAAAGRVKTLDLPRWAQPPVEYQACVVRRPGGNGEGANAFISKLTAPAGRSTLREHGFGLPAADSQTGADR